MSITQPDEKPDVAQGREGEEVEVVGADGADDLGIFDRLTHHRAGDVVELPEGEWVYLFSGETLSGTVTLEIPLDAFPVFTRKGSAVGEDLAAAL